MKPILQRKSTDGLGVVIWWYDRGRCIRRVPAAYSTSGKVEYYAEWLPYNGIMFTRTQPALTLVDARHWLRFAYLPGRRAITATGRSFLVAEEDRG